MGKKDVVLLHKPLTIITGPSGAGKTELVQAAIHERPDQLVKFITTTDRLLRPHEKHKVDYYRVFPYQFRNKIKKGKLFEWNEVYSKGWYGCEYAELKRIRKLPGNKRPIIITDVEGALKFAGKMDSPQINLEGIEVKVIYIHSTQEEMELRLRADMAAGKRNDSEQKILERIQRMEYELDQMKHFEHVVRNVQGQFTFSLNQFLNKVLYL